jgi:hypothetical protein
MTMTSFKTPPPIEDLSEIAWRRVEQGLLTELADIEPVVKPQTEKGDKASRGGNVAWVGLGLGLAAAAALLFVVLVRSDSLGQRPQATVQPQVSELTTQDSSTTLDLLGASMEVAANSSVSIEQADDRLRIDLHTGSVKLKVMKRDHLREPVAVVSGKVRVDVMGTEFAVFRSEQATQVKVFEGVVSVTSGGERSLVRKGQSWPPAVGASAPASRESDLRRAQKKNQAKEAPASISAQELYDEAAQLEVKAPREAIELYRRAARGTGAWAANALFAQARLLLANGNRTAARKLLERYLSEHPRGANVADAEALLGQ